MSSAKAIKRVCLLSSLALSSTVFAGGFQLWEEDIGGLGDYHAGAAAEADTAGTEFYNAAGVTRLDKQEVSLGVALIDLDVNYSGNVYVNNASIGNVNNQTGATMNGVPNFHYVLPLPHHLWFSFGETTPFGLETNYPTTNPIALLATETKLETFNLNPSLAYEVNKYLSVAAGFDALYGSADYDSMIFLSDNSSTLSSDLSGWGYGYNVGALFQFEPHTRFGISYRSEVDIDASGNSHSTKIFSIPANNTTASATLNLPATTIATLYHDFTSKFTMMASAFYTQWSCFDTLAIQNLATPTGAQTVSVLENYRNTWNLALGGKYYFNKFLSLEGGFGHDETPTQEGYRDIRLPDNNRYAMSLGLNIYPKKGLIWSMGWTHFFVPTTAINNSQSVTNSEQAVSIGNENGNINVIGTQFSIVI